MTYEKDLATLYSFTQISPSPKLEDITRAWKVMYAGNQLGYRFVPMINEEGEIGLYYDNDSDYLDIDFEEGGMLSVFARDRITSDKFYEELSDVELLVRLEAT